MNKVRSLANGLNSVTAKVANSLPSFGLHRGTKIVLVTLTSYAVFIYTVKGLASSRKEKKAKKALTIEQDKNEHPHH